MNLVKDWPSVLSAVLYLCTQSISVRMVKKTHNYLFVERKVFKREEELVKNKSD